MKYTKFNCLGTIKVAVSCSSVEYLQVVVLGAMGNQRFVFNGRAFLF